jgi:hypothetical protein
MKKLSLFSLAALTACAFAFSIAGCSGGGSDVTGTPVTWQEVNAEQHNGEIVTVEGYAELPFLMMIQDDGRASVHLSARQNQSAGGMIVMLIEEGDFENAIMPLPDDYGQEDLILTTNDGKKIDYRQKIRVTGKADFTEKTKKITVEKIEAIDDNFSYEKEAVRMTDDRVGGELVFAEGVIFTPDEQGGISLDMLLDDSTLSDIVTICFPYGPDNNQADELPEDGYSDSDILIRDDSGNEILPESTVRVYGVWSDKTDQLYVEKVILIE